MEQVKHDTAAGDYRQWYSSPEVRVVFVKAQGILCISNPDSHSTEMEEGNDNW